MNKADSIHKLRRKGASIIEISNSLGLPKSTVFRYARFVEMSKELHSALSSRRGGSKKRKELAEIRAYEDGRNIVGGINDRDRLMFASALYWAEGNKKDFILTNSDPVMIRFFIETIRRVFNLEPNDLQVSLRLYEDLDRDNCIAFWASITGVSSSDFISVSVLEGKKIGKLTYGMCRVRIRKGGLLLKKIIGINKAVVSQG